LPRLGLLIGPKGSTQKQLQERTGAKILIRGKGSQKDGYTGTHPDDDDELHVAIEGSEEAVENATKEVEQILFNPEEAIKLKGEQLRTLGSQQSSSIYGPGTTSEYQEELKVPNSMVGLIIGRGGENIQKLQMQTGAHIQIAKESDMLPGETHRSIFLHGKKEHVAELRRAVEDIIATRSSSGASHRGLGSNTLDHPIVMKVPVPNERVGYIIGRGGMNVRNIQEKTRTIVQIPPGPDEHDPSTRTISIGADTKEAAEAAHAEIVSALQQYAQNNMSSGSNTMLMCVPDDKVGIIIGRGGATIKDIQNRHRVRVQIPQQADIGSNPPVRTCSITGPAESQMAARYEIEMILQGQASGIPQTSYSAAAAYDPNAAAWAAYGQAAYDPNMYAAYYSQAAAATATTTAGATEAVPSDPTAYYNDFWKYASYYGEANARTYYGAWSPPVGTPPPPGITLPPATGDQPAAVSSDRAESSAAHASSNVAETNGSDQTAKASDASDPSASSSAAADPSTGATDAWEAYKKQVRLICRPEI
jgi:far upstream element-binding protein